MPPLLRIGHKRLTGNFNVVLNGNVTPVGTHFSSVLSGDLPAGFDPALRGSDLVYSTNWHNMAISTDQGHQALLDNNAGAGAAVGDGTFTGQLISNPHFGNMWRCRNMPVPSWVGQSTIQRGITLPTPLDSFWLSVVMYWDGNGNTNGAVPTQGGPYPDHFTSFGTGIPGGSTTYKIMFAFPINDPTIPARGRMELELLNGGGFTTGVGHREPIGTYPSKVESLLPQGGAPVPPWGSQLSAFAKNAVDAAHDMRGTKDLYHMIFNKVGLSPSSYIQRYYLWRLTENGNWNPWQYPVWKGWLTTGGLNLPYNEIHFTGNKSQSNDGPNEQWLHGACLEINKASDPWGLANYGI